MDDGSAFARRKYKDVFSNSMGGVSRKGSPASHLNFCYVRRDFYCWSKIMAVQKSRVTRSRRGMRRSHDRLTGPTLSVDQTTGTKHRRHHISEDGYYRGRQVIVPPAIENQDEE